MIYLICLIDYLDHDLSDLSVRLGKWYGWTPKRSPYRGAPHLWRPQCCLRMNICPTFGRALTYRVSPALHGFWLSVAGTALDCVGVPLV